MTRRLLLVANWLHDVGGVQTATRSLAAALESRGHRVTLVSVLPSLTAAPSPIETLYPVAPLRRRLERGAVTTRIARLDLPGRAVARARLRRLAARADAVIAMDVFASEVAAGAIPRTVPLYVQFHNTAAALAGTRDLDRLLRLRARTEWLVALTDADALRFRQEGFSRVVAIPNVVAMPPAPARRRGRLVVGLGRYTTVKRFDLLIRAWSALPPEIKGEWRLELHGEGPESDALALAASAEPSVRVLGPTNDVGGVLADASLLVLPSAFEGLPMVLLEAMSSGVPCVATRSSPGVSGLVDGAGWLVPVDDEPALTRALAEAVGSESARTAAAAEGALRMARYAPAAVSEAWEQLLSTEAPR